MTWFLEIRKVEVGIGFLRALQVPRFKRITITGTCVRETAVDTLALEGPAGTWALEKEAGTWVRD